MSKSGYVKIGSQFRKLSALLLFSRAFLLQAKMRRTTVSSRSPSDCRSDMLAITPCAPGERGSEGVGRVKGKRCAQAEVLDIESARL